MALRLMVTCLFSSSLMKPNAILPRILSVVLLAGMVLSTASSMQAAPFGNTTAKLSQRLQRSADRFAAMQSVPGKRIPPQLIARARGIIIIHKLKAGFIIGGEAGNGVAMVRNPRTGQWSAPAFVSSAAGSWGLQIGAKESTVVMLLMNEAGLKPLQGGSLNIGVNVAATAGPLDEGAGINTATISAPILVYSSGGGLFAGAAIQGGGIIPAEKSNGLYYGRIMNDVLFDPAVQPDPWGQRLIQTIYNFSAR